MSHMTKELEFFIYLLLRYAVYKQKKVAQILKIWDRLNLTDDIYAMYERYHCERLENAFEDIDAWMLERQAS